MRALPYTARRLSAAALAFFSCLSVGPTRAQDADAHAYRAAYDSAIKCFIADGIVAGDERRDGNTARQAALEGKARESFEIALKAGKALGYSGTRIDEDFGLAQSSEASRLVNDTAYFKQAATTCKQLGLM